MPPPTHPPWIAAITGFRHSSKALNESCMSFTSLRNFSRSRPMHLLAPLSGNKGQNSQKLHGHATLWANGNYKNRTALLTCCNSLWISRTVQPISWIKAWEAWLTKVSQIIFIWALITSSAKICSPPITPHEQGKSLWVCVISSKKYANPLKVTLIIH